MAPTEASLLATYLLSRAQLRDFLTPQQFTELFPRSQRSHPHVSVLYRELQHQRALVADEVERNIAIEVKRGERQRREVVNARRRAEQGRTGLDQSKEDAREMQMEIELFGPASDLASRKPHTLGSIVEEMDSACQDIEEEIEVMDRKAEQVLGKVKEIIEQLEGVQSERSEGDESTIDMVKVILKDLRQLEKSCNDTESKELQE